MDFLQLHRTEVPSTQNLGKCVVNVKILPMIILRSFIIYVINHFEGAFGSL